MAIEKATRVLNNLKSLGFNNRGIKYLVEHEGKHLGELESTKMQAIIVEVCFVESKVDVDIYKSKGYKHVARAISNGLANILSWYLEDCICVDHTQYNEGIGSSVYSVGALKGIPCDVAIRGKSRRDTLDLVLKRIGL